MMNTVASVLASDSAAIAAGRSGVLTGAATASAHYLGWLQDLDVAWWGTAFSILGVSWMVFNGAIRLYWESQDRKRRIKKYESEGMENAE